ncbi:hypothetical protein [Yersinia aleksiciae]|uniref:hypothetical protein n=1 Tax=Yersinia aleksiciae TaxID=263819 RepID=UPI0011A9BB76|nr:hypothetical protein [Yersinia aleksiciae]
MNRLTEQELQEMTVVYGNRHNACRAAKELLSLREQLEALKVWATNRAIGDDALENENYTSIIVNWRKRQLNDLLTNEKNSIFIAVQEALATAAKPDDVNNKVDITCYSCRRFITFQQRAEADGCCPYCNVEIELESKGD